MAKWGEGDPRWIVEERPDATNVNNWHWSEKNATPWSKDRLKSLFNALTIANDEIECIIESVEKCDGEATANNRKGKLILFYEWDISLKWKGKRKTNEDYVNGSISIPNLSEENKLTDIDITVTIPESNKESEFIKKFMYDIGREKLREVLGIYLKELCEEFTKGLFLPKKDDPQSGNILKNTEKVTMSGFNKKSFANSTIKSTSNCTPGEIECKSITMNENFQCRAEDLFRAFVDEKMVVAFTQREVILNPVENGEFEFFGGNIKGIFHQIIPYKTIIQSWRYNQWPEGHYSNVEMEFTEKDDHTALKIVQTGVPEFEVQVTLNNWKRYYFNSIRQTFGFGSFLQ